MISLRRAAICVLLPFLLALGGTEGSSTDLRITFLNSGTNGGDPIRVRLKCDPPRGNVFSPEASCLALDRRRAILFAEAVEGDCWGPLIFTETRVVGAYRGEKVERYFERCFNRDRTTAWQSALRITALDVWVIGKRQGHTNIERQHYLDCHPTQGSVPRPARSCAALARESGTLLRAGDKPCLARIHVFGLYRGRSVSTACEEPASSRRWMAVLGITA